MNAEPSRRMGEVCVPPEGRAESAWRPLRLRVDPDSPKPHRLSTVRSVRETVCEAQRGALAIGRGAGFERGNRLHAEVAVTLLSFHLMGMAHAVPSLSSIQQGALVVLWLGYVLPATLLGCVMPLRCASAAETGTPGVRLRRYVLHVWVAAWLPFIMLIGALALAAVRHRQG